MSSSLDNTIIQLADSSQSASETAVSDGVNIAPAKRELSGNVTKSGRKQKVSAKTSCVRNYFLENNTVGISAENVQKKVTFVSLNTGMTVSSDILTLLTISSKTERPEIRTKLLWMFPVRIMDPMAMNATKKAEILKALVEFVVDNKQPFQIVASKSFEIFCKKLNRHFELPSRWTLFRAMHDEYADPLQMFQS